MSPRPSRCTKAELSRAITVAKEHGWHRVELFPSGKIVIGDGLVKPADGDDDDDWKDVT